MMSAIKFDDLDRVIISNWIRDKLKQKRHEFNFPKALILLIMSFYGMKLNYMAWDRQSIQHTSYNYWVNRVKFKRKYASAKYIAYNHVLLNTPNTLICATRISGADWRKYVYKVTVYEISNNSCIGIMHFDKKYGIEFTEGFDYALSSIDWPHGGRYKLCNGSVRFEDHFKFVLTFTMTEKHCRKCSVEVFHCSRKTKQQKLVMRWQMYQSKKFQSRNLDEWKEVIPFVSNYFYTAGFKIDVISHECIQR